ncbi:TIGR02611 family protein [Sciscionella marina]|uniref:TIGR02611 family protein n=1 Tax=Sciscionella marina TaxID=508770 RepID=UPI000371454A|nr:TIGR02611 family protein [Sciscionella marina]
MRQRLRTVVGDLHRWRDADPRRQFAFRIAIGVLGTLVTVGGLVMIPFPGPGWLVVFAGLGILATEFTWARRLLEFAKRYYNAWLRWMGEQNWFVRSLVLTGLFALILAVLWLIGVFSLVGGWFGIEWPWLRSPVFGG